MNKVALVTGASRGIGAATARRLAADGFAVALACHANGDAAEAVADAIRKNAGRATVLTGDLADPEVPARLVAGTVEAFGRLDALVNNAGFARGGTLPDVAVADFDAEVAVNMRAPLLMMQAAMPHLERAGGAVVNISSLNGSRMPSRGAPVYSMTKAALDVLTRSVAAEWGSRGIRVNAVAPGATRTDTFLRKAGEEVQNFFVRRTALGRLGEPEEVAAAVAFLLSSDACWITGQILSASGGFE